MAEPLEMNLEIRARWVAALRSGEYPQAKSALHNEDGYCCLGVLCDLAEKDRIVASVIDEDGLWIYDDEPSLLPRSVWQWAGLQEQSPVVDAGELTGLNDDEAWTFAQIADAIEGIEPKEPAP